MNILLRARFIPALIATFLMAGIIYWFNQQQVESTSYSTVTGKIIEISPEVDGKVAQVFIKDHQQVKQGDLLFELDQTPFNIEIERSMAQLNESKRNLKERQIGILNAEAILRQREAELEKAKALAKRRSILIDKAYPGNQERNNAAADLKIPEAKLAAAKEKLEVARLAAGNVDETNEYLALAFAALKQSQFNANRSKIFAPTDGVVSHFSVDPGEIVRAKEPLFKIVTNNNLWIEAHFQESQLQRIRKGQKATIHLASYPDYTFHGVIESIAAATTDPQSVVISGDPKWVTVKIRFTDAGPKYPLRIGTSGKVNVLVNSKS